MKVFKIRYSNREIGGRWYDNPWREVVDRDLSRAGLTIREIERIAFLGVGDSARIVGTLIERIA